MTISNRRIQEPVEEPVTTDEVDNFLRGNGVLEEVDAVLLQSMIFSAREYVEETTRQALITQKWEMFMDAFPRTKGGLGWWDGVREGAITQDQKGSFELPIGPLQSVDSISTFNMANEETVFDSANYFLNTTKDPGEVILNSTAIWPTFTRHRNGIRVVYNAGFGDKATDVPSPLRLAIKMLITHWYENREYTKTQSDMNQATAPLHVQSMINRYKRFRL